MHSYKKVKALRLLNTLNYVFVPGLLGQPHSCTEHVTQAIALLIMQKYGLLWCVIDNKEKKTTVTVTAATVAFETHVTIT